MHMQQTSNCLCCGNPQSSKFSLKGWHTLMEECFFHGRFTTGANVRGWQRVWEEGEKAGASPVRRRMGECSLIPTLRIKIIRRKKTGDVCQSWSSSASTGRSIWDMRVACYFKDLWLTNVFEVKLPSWGSFSAKVMFLFSPDASFLVESKRKCRSPWKAQMYVTEAIPPFHLTLLTIKLKRD